MPIYSLPVCDTKNWEPFSVFLSHLTAVSASKQYIFNKCLIIFRNTGFHIVRESSQQTIVKPL